MNGGDIDNFSQKYCPPPPLQRFKEALSGQKHSAESVTI